MGTASPSLPVSAAPAALKLGGDFVSTPRYYAADSADDEKSLMVISSPGMLKAGFMAAKSGFASTSLPPRIMLSQSVRDYTGRYVASTSGTYTINVQDVFGALGGICTVVNSKVASWTSSFRIKKVTLWPSASSSAAVSGAVSWATGSANQIPDSIVDETIPQGTTLSRGLAHVPPKQSLAAFWVNYNSGANLFTLTVVAGTVIDLQVETRLSAQYPPTLSTVAAGVVGSVYYLSLDGPASNKLIPVVLPTTA
jgi:hypothetical protein